MAVTVKISNGGTVSTAADFHSTVFSGIVLPAAFSGATITFQASADGVTYQTLYNDSNTAITITVTQARTYAFKADLMNQLGAWRFVKVVSAGAEGADRYIVLWAR